MPPVAHEFDYEYDSDDWGSDDDYAHKYYPYLEFYESDDESDGASHISQAKAMTMYIRREKPFKNLKRGDTVVLTNEAGYRNNGVNMWNGEKVVNLYTSIDDYGSVPPEFEIGYDNDFDAYSWQDLIDHNSIVWFSAEIRSTMIFGEDLKCEVNIRGTLWTFDAGVYRIGSNGKYRAVKVDELHNAIRMNRCVFYASSNNTVYVQTTEYSHGVIREPNPDIIKAMLKEQRALYEIQIQRARDEIKKITDKITAMEAKLATLPIA